jgi:hypothetical protein
METKRRNSAERYRLLFASTLGTAKILKAAMLFWLKFSRAEWGFKKPNDLEPSFVAGRRRSRIHVLYNLVHNVAWAILYYYSLVF